MSTQSLLNAPNDIIIAFKSTIIGHRLSPSPLMLIMEELPPFVFKQSGHVLHIREANHTCTVFDDGILENNGSLMRIYLSAGR